MEKAFWSIVLPGFGQLLNGKFLKGLLLNLLKVLINVQLNFNKVIIYSFHTYWHSGDGKSFYSFLRLSLCLFRNSRVDLFLKSKYIWGTIRSCFSPMLFLIIGISIGLYKLYLKVLW